MLARDRHHHAALVIAAPKASDEKRRLGSESAITVLFARRA